MSQQLRPRRAATVVASALTAALVLAGCSSDSEEEQPEGVEVPVTTPASFANTATWEFETDADAPVVVTDYGILTLVPASGINSYSPAMIHPSTGEPRWTGRPIDGSDEPPEISWVQQGDRFWVILVVTLEDENASLVYSYDGNSNNEDNPTTSSVRFEGEDGPPRVRASSSGVLVSNSDISDHLQYHPATGRVTEYGTAPTREGDVDGETTEVEGEPVQNYGGGWLLDYPDLGFGYATRDGGWESSDNVPPDADSSGGESILRTGSGYIIALWPGLSEDADSEDAEEDEGPEVMAVHDAQDGDVIARMEMTSRDQSALEEQSDRDVTYDVETNENWLVWGEFAFDLHSGEGEHIDLGLGEPISVIRDIVYVEDAERPQQSDMPPPPDPTPLPYPAPEDSEGTVETEEPAEPTEEGSAEDDLETEGTGSAGPTEEGTEGTEEPLEGGEEFNGFLAVDLGSQSTQPGIHEITPVDVSPYGQGIFVHDDTIYSIGFR